VQDVCWQPGLAGARWFGYPTFWVNRLNAPMEELNVSELTSDKNLEALVHLLNK
jgi:2-haloacid dehalogenase